MASVTLTTVWLSSAADLTDYINLPYLTGLTSAPQNPGTVRRYASGRFRVISQVGIPNQFALTATACTRTQIQWVESHTGQVLLVRDDRGRKFYGAYFLPSIVEHAYNDEGDLTVTVSEVSWDEAV